MLCGPTVTQPRRSSNDCMSLSHLILTSRTTASPVMTISHCNSHEV